MSATSNENNRYPKYVEAPSKQVNLAGSSGWSVAKIADVFLFLSVITEFFCFSAYQASH